MLVSKIIAVDFDGTIVEDDYPKIGREKPFAFQTLQQLQKDGYRLILWTYRYGERLQEAVDFCKKNGVDFYAVNSSYQEEQFNTADQSRKIHADYFIDDRNLGGFPGWGETYQILRNHVQFTLQEPKIHHRQKKTKSTGGKKTKSIFKKLLGI